MYIFGRGSGPDEAEHRICATPRDNTSFVDCTNKKGVLSTLSTSTFITFGSDSSDLNCQRPYSTIITTTRSSSSTNPMSQSYTSVLTTPSPVYIPSRSAAGLSGNPRRSLVMQQTSGTRMASDSIMKQNDLDFIATLWVGEESDCDRCVTHNYSLHSTRLANKWRISSNGRDQEENSAGVQRRVRSK